MGESLTGTSPPGGAGGAVGWLMGATPPEGNGLYGSSPSGSLASSFGGGSYKQRHLMGSSPSAGGRAAGGEGERAGGRAGAGVGVGLEGCVAVGARGGRTGMGQGGLAEGARLRLDRHGLSEGLRVGVVAGRVAGRSAD
jgi:hypothetical protein